MAGRGVGEKGSCMEADRGPAAAKSDARATRQTAAGAPEPGNASRMNALFPKLFRRQKPAEEAGLPPGYRVYAVGDVHGRLDLLDELLEQVEGDLAARPKAQTILVFLGDLIDRGPSSAGVVERVRTYRRPGVRVVTLCGNHEEVLLRLLRGEGDLLTEWLRFGGAECAESYGLDPRELSRVSPDRGLQMLRTAIPKPHVEFLRRLADTFRIGSYVFVHAGVRPGVAITEQAQADLRWIREPFLEHQEDHGFVVVHGHSIAEQVEQRPNRIGIDTGAYRTGVLTALGLEGRDRWLLQSGTVGAAALVPAAV